MSSIQKICFKRFDFPNHWLLTPSIKNYHIEFMKDVAFLSDMNIREIHCLNYLINYFTKKSYIQLSSV